MGSTKLTNPASRLKPYAIYAKGRDIFMSAAPSIHIKSPLGASPLQGTAAGILSCLIWSLAIFAMNRLATSFHPLWAAGLELAIAGVFILGVGWLRGDLNKMRLHSTKCHLLCGTFWSLNIILSWLSVALVHNSGELLVAGLLNYLWPALTLLLAIPILNKRATWWLAPGLAAVLVGIALAKISTAPQGTTTGAFAHLNVLAYSFAILDAIAWALYSNLSRKLSNPLGASAVPVYMLITSVGLLTASYMSEPASTASLADWYFLVAWAIATGLAYLLWDVGMRRGNVITISATSMFTPLLSTLITAIMSGHGVSSSLLIAAALVVAGSTVCRRGVR